MDALLLAVLNAVWQGAALIALVSLALRWGLRRNATTACVVWSVAFAVVALLPALDFALARPARSPADDAVFSVRVADLPTRTTPARVRTMNVTFTRAPRYAAGGDASPAPAAGALLLDRARAGAGAALLRIGGAATPFARTWGFALVCAWALIAGVLLFRLARAYAAIAAMKRAATPLDEPRVLARLRAAGHRRRAAVACSPSVTIPCAVGFRRPMILVPAGLAASLDAEDLARIVLHESAHLQRYDDWVNALEQAVCALQFFQPALYFARRRIDFEREVACDDRVLEDAGEPLRYAECLARIVQRHMRGSHAAVVPGFVLRRAQVVARVRRIVDRSRDASPHLRFGALALGAGVLIVTLGIARLQVPVVMPALALPAPVPASQAAPHARTPGAKPAHRHHPHAAHHVTAPVAPIAPALANPSPSPSPAAPPAGRPAAAATAVRAARAPVAQSPPAAAAPGAVYVRASTPVVLAAEAARASAANTTPRAEELAAAAAASAPSAPVVHAHLAARLAAQAVAIATADGDAATPFVVQAGAPAVRFAHRDGDMLDAIDEAKYPHPSVDELIALRNQGVTGDYIRKMAALGRPRPSLRDILALATQGITPEYVATLDRRLASPPSLDRVIALRVQGVSAAWLDALAEAGYPKLTSDDAIALAVQGIRSSYVRGLMDAGMRSLTPMQLVQLRVQGIDGNYVRRLAAHGYKNLDVDALVRLKVSGFEP